MHRVSLYRDDMRVRHSCVHAGLMYLRLGEHVQAPGAHLAVGGNADQVVSVLGSHHVHAVNRVLNRAEHTSETTNTREEDGPKDTKVCVRSGALLCALPQTGAFSEQGCACCSCCPTRQSVRSTSRPPPGWGGTLRTRLTSPRTRGGTKSRRSERIRVCPSSNAHAWEPS